MIDNSNASLAFLPDGQLAGSYSCNRILGSYANKEGQSLTLELAGATMMACPAALKNQEQSLLDLLPTINSFEFDETGAQILSTTEDKTITARRK